MTEIPNPNDQAERLRRLQERRAASSRSNRIPTDSAGSTPTPSPSKSRRRHPAAATRIFLAGLSVTSFFAVGGAIAVANHPAAVQTVAAATPVNGAGTPATSGTKSTAGAAAQPATATNVAVHTTTGGS